MGACCVRRCRTAAHISITLLLIVLLTVFIIFMLLEMPEKMKIMVISLIFAPFGACFRQWLTTFYLDKRRFPVGTLLVNLLGVTIVCLLHILFIRLSPFGCDVKNICWPSVLLPALEIGFCGSLTTISDIASEFFDLKKHGNQLHAYAYVILTLASSQLIADITNGVNNSMLER